MKSDKLFGFCSPHSIYKPTGDTIVLYRYESDANYRCRLITREGHVIDEVGLTFAGARDGAIARRMLALNCTDEKSQPFKYEGLGYHWKPEK